MSSPGFGWNTAWRDATGARDLVCVRRSGRGCAGKRAAVGREGIAARLGCAARRGVWTSAAIPTGAAAGAEDEVDGGRGLRGEALALREDEEAPVQALAHLEPSAGVGAAAGELDPAGPEADGVVVGHDAGVATAEEGREITGGGAPGGGDVGGGVGEAAVEVGEERGEEG